MPPDFAVEPLPDGSGYRVCLPEDGPFPRICAYVSSAHLIEEKKVQLLRYRPTTPTPC